MKSERILNIFLGSMLMALLVQLARHEDCLLGGRTAGQCSPAGPVLLRVDTVWLHDTISTGSPVMVKEVVREVPARVDTSAIVASFYAERTYSDTLQLRDLGTVHITDAVSQNSIVGRTVAYELGTLHPSIVYGGEAPRSCPPARLALSAGVQLGLGQAAVIGGVRHNRTEFGLVYDLRQHAPGFFVKQDLWRWQ